MFTAKLPAMSPATSAYQLGDPVVTPRGGMEGIVAEITASESVIATTDGQPVSGVWCEHRAEEIEAMYYEYLAGPGRGSHGWFDGRPSCRKVYQTG